MSVESAKSFINRMKSDEEFARRATECRDAKAWLALAQKAGFDISIDDITVEDIQEALRQLSDD